MRSSVEAVEFPGLVGRTASEPMAIRRAVERLIAVGYGPTYDAIFRSFPWYHALLREVLDCAQLSLEARPDVAPPRVLEQGCGTGNVALALAERGYAVVGEDPYAPLVARARRKAAARRVANLTFRPVSGTDGGYDLAVSVHVLYAHPDPLGELRRLFVRLRPGGHAIVVNFARSAPVVATAREVWSREGAGAALHSLRWLLPNAFFDLVRGRRQSHFWRASEFRHCLEGVGFEVLELRPTFLHGMSLLAWCRKKRGARSDG